MSPNRSKTLRLIAVDEQNYFALKRLGTAGDSFNDVIKEILKKQELAQTSEQVGGPRMSALEASSTQGGSSTSNE